MIKKKYLSNNILIYILNDKYFQNYIKDDLIIKFNNYGAMLDIKNNIYGMQHLLEHAIFEKYRNLNVYTNASTSVNDMTIELNFSKEYKITEDPCIKFIKKCLFKNNDYTKINLSRELNEKEIRQYVNELNAEYMYRSNLPIPWNLQTLIYSNSDVSYFGGNNNTFKNKIKNIQKYLKNPTHINPKDIVIILKKSKIIYLEIIEKIFEQIKKIDSPKLELNIKPENYYNKIIKINEAETNQISFLIYKKDLNYKYDILYIIEILYPFFSFEISTLNEIFLTFLFSDLFSLFNFFNILKFFLFEKLSLKSFNFLLLFELNYFMLNNYFPDKIINKFFNERKNITYAEYYNENETDIKIFFKFLSNLIKEKKFFLNTTKDFVYNKECNISLEKILLIDTNIINNFFLNKNLENFNIIKYIKDKFYSSTFKNIKHCNNLKCFNKILMINENDNWIKNSNDFRTFSFDVKNGKLIKCNTFIENYKISYLVYINSLILFFSNPIFDKFQNCLEYVSKNKDLGNFIDSYFKDINLKFSKKNFLIHTGYDFIFCVVKINKKNINKILNLNANIEENLKRLGLAYYLEMVVYNLKNFCLLFFFTQSDKENSIQIYNVIKNILNLNYIKNEIIYVISEKSFELDLKSLNKFVKFTI